jgi:hypothetical protein
MALVGLKRASELTGKNQSTIHRAMKSGRILQPQRQRRAPPGERLLDTSELNRLFPLKSDDDGLRNEAPTEPRNEAQAAELRERLAFMQQRIDALEADKTDLRAERDRLLSVIETQAQQGQVAERSAAGGATGYGATPTMVVMEMNLPRQTPSGRNWLAITL